VRSRAADLDFEAGPPEVLVVKEVPDPQPAAGEMRIRVEASGVNFADVLSRLGLPPQQSGGELASAVSTTRARHAALSKHEDAAEVQLSSRPGPQQFQSGAPSRHPADLQTETLGRIGGVARPCGLNAA
jgi:hypothetical protein